MRILLAIDGSPTSECVMNELNRLKITKDTEIFLLTAVERIGPIMAEPFTGAMIEYESEIEKKNLEVAFEIVRDAKTKLEKKFGCHVRTEVATGTPKHLIVERAADWEVDVIILGSHGYGLWERVLLGSVSTFVAQHAKSTVVIARCR
jgi:nucleotide-binding universal stress UspA family protein